MTAESRDFLDEAGGRCAVGRLYRIDIPRHYQQPLLAPVLKSA